MKSSNKTETAKKISIGEFSRYIENAAIGPITFYYKDQDWYDFFGVVPEFRHVFPKISVDLNPTYVTLYGSNDNLTRLHGVDYIQVDPDAGRIAVHCKAGLSDCSPQERTYIFRVDPKKLPALPEQERCYSGKSIGARLLTLAPIPD